MTAMSSAMTVNITNIVDMTNKEVEGKEACDPRLAALYAVHLVSKILDEAYVIANAATESGQPWHYLSMLKNVQSDRQCDPDDEDTMFKAPKGDSDIVNENKIEHDANVVATSTPAKVTDGDTYSDEIEKNKPDSSYIGQGDEEIDLNQNELTKSTSMFINNLFDMSDVERPGVGDETENIESKSEAIESNEETSSIHHELVTEAMAKIMDSYVNTALDMTVEEPRQSIASAMPMERSSSSEHSDYSFLTDAFGEDTGRDTAFYIHDDEASDIERDCDCGTSHLIPAVEIRELCDEMPIKLIETNEVTRYENAYLTLNRDYDQCSEDEADPILEDPKGMTMQEVELMTANTSEENLPTHHDPEPHSSLVQPKIKEFAAISGVSAAASGSRKSSLVSKCRSQGARLLACLRGWWRRRTPGKRKENRGPCPVRGFCPLSPDARRRAASLLDQRLLRSPSPSRAVVWKFNTVNESLVHSSRWKEYTFDANPEECGEY